MLTFIWYRGMPPPRHAHAVTSALRPFRGHLTAHRNRGIRPTTRPQRDLSRTRSGQDQHDNCDFWAEIKECDKNPTYMNSHCPKACGICTDDGSVPTRTVKEVRFFFSLSLFFGGGLVLF